MSNTKLVEKDDYKAINSIVGASSLTFKSATSLDEVEDPKVGDVVLLSDTSSGSVLCYTGNNWEDMIVDPYTNTESNREVKKTKCDHCGALLKMDKYMTDDGLCKCEYCRGFTYVYGE